MYKLAVFLSGGGSNLQALLDAQARGEFANAQVVLVIADRKNAAGVARAESAGIPGIIISRKKPQSLLPVLLQHGIDRIVLAGYLSILPPEVIAAYRQRIINIHPSLLPLFGGKGFFGLHVHEAVLESGMKITGATVHFVDEDVDTGRIIAQRAVPVMPGDTPQRLQERVLETEHALLVEVVKDWTNDIVM